jgi:mono/diheme cytochrome c family protein
MHRPVLALCALAMLAAALACGGGGAQEPARADRPAAQSPAPEPPAMAADGAGLFESLECIHCHRMDGGGPGPSLVGLYGESIRLENGETVTADAQYIRTSILDPQAHIHAGYPPIMPAFEGRIDEQELSMLVEYIRSLNAGSR